MWEITTKTVKKDVHQRIRELMLEHVIPVLAEYKNELEESRTPNGKNQTFRFDNCFFSNPETGEKYAIGCTVNYWERPTAKVSMRERGTLAKLAPADVVALDKAIAIATDAADIDMAVKLNTIKQMYLRDGGVSEEQQYLVLGLRYSK
jgi:hypothetical protein